MECDLFGEESDDDEGKTEQPHPALEGVRDQAEFERARFRGVFDPHALKDAGQRTGQRARGGEEIDQWVVPPLSFDLDLVWLGRRVRRDMGGTFGLEWEARPFCLCAPFAGSEIDIWHDAGPPANSSTRSRSLHPSGGAATRDPRPINCSQKLRMVPGSQVRPPRPDRTRTKVRGWPPNKQPRIMTLHATVLPVLSARRTGDLFGSGSLTTRRPCQQTGQSSVVSVVINLGLGRVELPC